MRGEYLSFLTTDVGVVTMRTFMRNSCIAPLRVILLFLFALPYQGAAFAQSLELETNNSPSTATALRPDTSISGQLSSSSDIDYFSVAVRAAGTINLSVTRPYTQGIWRVSIEDSAGNLLASRDISESSRVIMKPQAVSVQAAVSNGGVYFIRVAASTPDSHNGGTYSITSSGAVLSTSNALLKEYAFSDGSYFYSALPSEQQVLETGQLGPGWVATGNIFLVWSDATKAMPLHTTLTAKVRGSCDGNTQVV